MITTSHPAIRDRHDRIARRHHWTAVLATTLFHLLLVLLVMPPPPTGTSAPRGSANGSAMEVTLLDEEQEQAQPLPPEPVPPRRARRRKPAASQAVRLPTPVAQATVAAPTAPDTSTEPPAPASSPSNAPDDNAVIDFPVNRPRNDNARASAALAAKLRGGGGSNATPAPDGPSMGVDGFHVYYSLAHEERLRSWRDQGMTELFLPLPGTRRLMVCPLDVALHRGSSACRMVDEDAPELARIGDAREVIDINQVYQLGDLVWRGPGPYR